MQKIKFGPALDTGLFLRLYYLTATLYISWSCVKVVTRPHHYSWTWLWPVKWMSHVPDPETIMLGVCALTILLFAACTLFPFKTGLKITASICLFFLLAIRGSSGKISHNLHPLLYTSFFVAAMVSPRTLSDRVTNQFLHRAAQINLVLIYSLAGIWKMRYLVMGMNVGYGVETLQRALPQMIAVRSIYTGKLSELARWLIELPPWLHAGLWVVVLIGETILPPLLFYFGALRLLGLALLLFHSAAFTVMGIHFGGLVLMVTLFFLLCPRPHVEAKL